MKGEYKDFCLDQYSVIDMTWSQPIQSYFCSSPKMEISLYETDALKFDKASGAIENRNTKISTNVYMVSVKDLSRNNDVQ